MKKIYHIEPIYKSFVWAGEKLKEYFNIDTDQKQIGTVYHVISVEGQLDNIVKEVGEPLSTFYKNNRELFNCDSETFPIRMTTTCNEGFQSYQVHPDDEYAYIHDNKAKGKVSGSVTIDETDEIRSRKFGHKCKNLDEFKECVETKKWDKIFNYLEVKTGDYVHTPAGVIHGGYGDGKITCTFGSNGDLTYRFYDLDRNDPKRPLRIQDVYNLQVFPDKKVSTIHVEPELKNGLRVYDYYQEKGEYVAKRIKCETEGTYSYPGFLFVSAINGECTINNEKIVKGETIFVPANFGELHIEGNVDLILISYY